MKRLFVILLTVLFLVGCGSSSSSEEKPASNDTKEEAAEEAKEEPAEEESKKEEPKEFTQELFSDDNCSMTVTGFDPDDMFGFAVKVNLENYSDLNLMFAAEDVSVNGYMIDPFWAAEVAAGKKSKESITFFSSDLEENEIEKVEEIEMKIRVYDNDDWTADPLIEEVFTINPVY